MKAFDKRKVPGLEDCSSESDGDDEIAPKRHCNSEEDIEDNAQDVEIELEVHDNEFLQEEPMINNEEISKKSNNVWGNVVQETLLDECFNKVGVNKMNIRRNIESYSRGKEEPHMRKRKHITKTNGHFAYEFKHKDVKQRIETRSFNKFKDRSHIRINPETDSQQTIVFEIARLLKEPKIELIERCFNFLGKDKCLEFYYMTEDIEENGGLLVVNGSRRRTAGGVFLTLIKESEHINDECKRLIFQYDFNSRKIAQPRSFDKGKVYDLQLDCKKIVVALKSESKDSNTSINAKVPNINKDTKETDNNIKLNEFEEGEDLENEEELNKIIESEKCLKGDLTVFQAKEFDEELEEGEII